MESGSPRWKEITPSEFPWEREALAFVRERLPDHEPYRAWSNFEFVGDDGSVNEVDLLVLTPKGFFLVEIKSNPGIVEGDQGSWVWRHEGEVRSMDNPLLLANRKAKKLIGLLRRQPSLKKVRSPFLEAHVFLSHERAHSKLPDYLAANVHLRDRSREEGAPERPGIAAALTRWPPEAPPRFRVDRPTVKAVSRAMEEAGIRRSQRSRRVGDYQLDELLLEGPTYQDWRAHHVALDETARVRIYGIRPDASEEEREAARRAARREYEILSGIVHEGILRPKSYTEHALGPALVFEHASGAKRFDHYLADRERGPGLDVDQRLHLFRQLAEAVHYAHEKRLVHRALSPESILVRNPEASLPRLQIYNWQTGLRESTAGQTTSLGTSGTSHFEGLVEDAAWVYLAPESVTERSSAGEPADVFSLGALAYRIFSGQPPAASVHQLNEKLRDGKGLQISSVLDGAWTELQLLIQYATHPEVTSRLETVSDVLSSLDRLEEEITAPTADEEIIEDPTQATPGDRLPHSLEVRKRLGKGSIAVALLVERNDAQHVLKVALTPEHNDRIRAEGEVLAKLRHQSIVELHDTLEFGDRLGLLLAKAGDRTLAERLREEGRLHLDLLDRFGEDLLQTVDWLEQKGIPHRDIKPENLGVAEVGRDRRLRLILFDFSLSRTPAENFRAGTRHYLDPFLGTESRPRWDPYAERYAAAVTLYEMATGKLPQWGDGRSEPAALDCEVTIDADAFEPSVRDGLVEFFRKTLRRSYAERFDNAQEMLRAWQQVFRVAERPEISTGHGEAQPVTSIESAALETRLSELGLSARALSAAERINVRTVKELLHFPLVQLHRVRGVGNRTRRELAELAKRLGDRFPDAASEPKAVPRPEDEAEVPEEEARASIDELLRRALPGGRGEQAERDTNVLRTFLGLDAPAEVDRAWPTQNEVARHLGLSPAPVSQALTRARGRWRKHPALTALRRELVELLDAQAGLLTVREAADALLARRGSVQEEPIRSRHAAAVVRAADEAERDLAAPRWILRRPAEGHALLLARDELDEQGEPLVDGQKVADYAERLGHRADELAAADPLPTPSRVLEALEAVPAPEGVTRPPSSRLLELAARTAKQAALSSRLELYPRGMEARRALKLALGALAGARELTEEALRKRVAGRYPEAAPLPGRPDLDGLLKEVGSDLEWLPSANEGRGAYRAHWREYTTVATGTTAPLRPSAAETPEEELDAQDFERRLARALEEKAFLALAVPAPRALEAEPALAARFPVDARSFDELLIRHMKDAAVEAGASWDVVLRADAAPAESRDWANLLMLVRHRALPRVREELKEAPRTVLLTQLGLLARYDLMAFVDELRDTAGRPGGPPGVWLLAAGDLQEERPMIDGKPVPVFTPGQWARLPVAWLRTQKAAGRPGTAAARESHPSDEGAAK